MLEGMSVLMGVRNGKLGKDGATLDFLYVVTDESIYESFLFWKGHWYRSVFPNWIFYSHCHLMATSKVAVALNPVPGFCVKSRTTNDTDIQLTASDKPCHVEKGLKIFVNLAWDPNVPPPPPASDDAVYRAMQGLDADESNPEAWFVPIVLSDARQDSDKG